jgi:hypothetical protein
MPVSTVGVHKLRVSVLRRTAIPCIPVRYVRSYGSASGDVMRTVNGKSFLIGWPSNPVQGLSNGHCH